MGRLARPSWALGLVLVLLGLQCQHSSAGTMRGGPDPEAKRINIVYANSGRAPDMLLRSAWSAIATASNSTRARLHFHFLHSATPGAPSCFNVLKEYGVRVHAYKDPVPNMPFKPKVHGYGMHFQEFRQKLESPANFWRFYLSEIMDEEMVLYLDGDTLFFQDIQPLWDSTHTALMASKHAMAAGVQENKACNFGKMLLLRDPRIAHLHMKSKEKCLTGGVIFINLKRWAERNMTKHAEEIIISNNEKKLYHLGSMPPLMIITYRNYLQLPDSAIHDSKGQKCCAGASLGKHTIWHPTKKIETMQPWQHELLHPPWITESPEGVEV